jgi:hypothetical protein
MSREHFTKPKKWFGESAVGSISMLCANNKGE